ncbi:MAG: sce7726 family protein [Urechidicola sp.]|nr:sce7726 family protein [Urechidicola sp.]
MILDKNINGRIINALAKNYNPLDYSVKLSTSLKNVFPTENFDNFSKYELHKLLNDTLFQYYKGEEILKYKLFQNYINKKSIVAAFEIKVNNSRLDFLTINGHTTSFEIKSELDNLSKLSKQMADYMLAFEYNYLVIDQKHIEKAKKILPESYGLWSYEKGKYKKLKKALLNEKMDSEVQLELLTKSELVNSFPNSRGEISNILDCLTAKDINSRFKKALKNRYRNRWEFLKMNKSEILPIDVQFFFNTNIEPSHIYYH